MEGFTSSWSIAAPWAYLAAVVFWGLAIRLVHALLRALKLTHDGGGGVRLYLQLVWGNFRGFHSKASGFASDYWYTYIIGTFELSAYPVFIQTQTWTPIGAWIGLKTIAQWSVWSNDRATFNLFLVGNIAVLAVAALVLAPMITVT